MLNNNIKHKTELFQKSNTSSPGFSQLNSSESFKRVSTAINSSSFSQATNPVFAISYHQRPPYELVIASSVTSVFSQEEIFKALLSTSENAVETSREKSDSAVKNVLVSIYELDRNGFGRIAAQEVMLFIEKRLRLNGLTEANRLLELADISKLSSRSLIGLIRSTARLKDHLPAWKIAYQHSRKQVAKQGKNPDALFVGLPKI